VKDVRKLAAGEEEALGKKVGEARGMVMRREQTGGRDGVQKATIHPRCVLKKERPVKGRVKNKGEKSVSG